MDIPSELDHLCTVATQATFSTIATVAWKDFRGWLGQWLSRAKGDGAERALAALDTNAEQIDDSSAQDRVVLERVGSRRWSHDLANLLRNDQELVEPLRIFLAEWADAHSETSGRMASGRQVAIGFDSSQIVQNIGPQYNTFRHDR